MVSLAPTGLISNRLDAQIKCAKVTINSQCVNNMYALHKASDYEEINMTPKGYITSNHSQSSWTFPLSLEFRGALYSGLWATGKAGKNIQDFFDNFDPWKFGPDLLDFGRQDSVNCNGRVHICCVCCVLLCTKCAHLDIRIRYQVSGHCVLVKWV